MCATPSEGGLVIVREGKGAQRNVRSYTSVVPVMQVTGSPQCGDDNGEQCTRTRDGRLLLCAK